jgi:hypothetical protein
MRGARPSQISHMMLPSAQAVGYFFLREEWDALLTRIASHSKERMDTGTDLMTLGHLGMGHGKEAGHYLDGAYPGVYLIPRKTACYFSCCTDM